MDQKNLTLTLVISGAIILVWMLFFTPSYEPAPAPAPTPVTAGGEAVPGAEGQPAPQPGTTTAGEPAKPRDRAQVLAESPRVGVMNPRLLGSINLTGGALDDLTLTEYRETLTPGSPSITLLAPRGSDKPYYLAVRWLGGEGVATPDAETAWTASASALAPGKPVTLSARVGEIDYEIVYALDENFLLTITQRATNRGTTPVSLSPYALVNRTGIPPTDYTYIVQEGFFGVLDNSYTELDYDELMEAPGGTVGQATTGGWFGITDKYWMVLLIPDQALPVKTRYVHTRTAAGDVFQADVTYPAGVLEPGQSLETTVRSYAGARVATIVDSYDEDESLGINRFYLAIDYGWIFFLSRPIYLALEWFYGIVGNFGVAILLLVVCVRILLFPLANKAYKSMARMRVLQPKMIELRERYKDDKAKFQQEIMGLYKKEGANPLAGCLPILMQIPIFIALYNVLYGTIEMRHAPFFGWIQDLSAPDPTSWINLFGLLPYDVPDLGLLNILSLGVWPLIMGFTMWAQYRLNPQPTDPMQAKIFAWMPVLFTFMLGQFAAGLVIYWAWNNLLSMAQQAYIMHRHGMPVGRKAQAAAAAKTAAEAKALAALPPEQRAEAEKAQEKPARQAVAKSQSKLKAEGILPPSKPKGRGKPPAKPKPKG
jgi:YidC/Oxa1 family membrane protein insertase